jgi:hypothetical protein
MRRAKPAEYLQLYWGRNQFQCDGDGNVNIDRDFVDRDHDVDGHGSDPAGGLDVPRMLDR